MSRQTQGDFCRITRQYDNFEKQYSDKTKRCGIEMLQDNFKVYESILKHKIIKMVLQHMSKVCKVFQRYYIVFGRYFNV
jgi:hypothetical protein